MSIITLSIDNELDKIPQELEKSKKKEWKNVGVLSYGGTSRPLQKRNDIKNQNEKLGTSNKNYNNIVKTNDYSLCDKNSIVNQEVIRKVLLHQYP